MNRIFILTAVFFLSCSLKSAAGEGMGANTQIFGKIHGITGDLRLKGELLNRYILYSRKETNDYGNSINIDCNSGTFNIKMQNVNDGARLYLYEAKTFSLLFDWQIVERGDSVKVDVELVDDGNDNKLNFSGRGSSKYECSYLLSKVKFDFVENQTVSRKIMVADSLLSEKLNLLESYKKKMSVNVFNVLRADIIGSHNTWVLGQLKSAYLDIRRPEEIQAFSHDKDFREVFARQDLQTGELPDAATSASVKFIEYLLIKEKIRAIYRSDGKLFTFRDVYLSIKERYKEKTRENLLAYLLMNTTELQIFFRGCDADDYDKCINDAIELVRTPWLKDYISNYRLAITKGQPAYNFRLPRDSSGVFVSLSDLKGKVFLLDIWNYPCTGCALFSGVFHKKIYPLFKDNPNFSVVSVMIGDSPKDSANYLSRLRGLEDEFGAKFSTYTFPEYINLFGGKGTEGLKMFSHYNTSLVPRILLIDKEGKIFSSTFGLFGIDENDPAVENLKQLITSALSQK